MDKEYRFFYWFLFDEVNGVCIDSKNSDGSPLRYSIVKDKGIMSTKEIKQAETDLIKWLKETK